MADKPAKPSRSPRKRVQAWVKEAAERAEGKATKEPILDREEKESGERYASSLEAVTRTARKRGKAIDLTGTGLPHLNPKHLKFVEALVTGAATNAMEAYTIAYGSKHASRASLWQKSSTLKSDPRTQAWLQAYSLAALDDMMTTAEKHAAQLARIREAALANGDFKAASMAELSRGKVAGLYQSTLVVEHRANDSALVDALTRALGADTAQQLASQLGITALPGDNARKIVVDAAIGETSVTVTEDEGDKGED